MLVLLIQDLKNRQLSNRVYQRNRWEGNKKIMKLYNDLISKLQIKTDL